jgi:hypothetical protein
VTISGVIVAVIAIHVNKRSQHEVNAIRGYLYYLRIAMDNPDLAFPAANKHIDYDRQVIGGDPQI